MRGLSLILLGAGLLVLAASASATDLSYAADTVPVLAQRANLVVRISRAMEVAGGQRLGDAVYAADVKEVLFPKEGLGPVRPESKVAFVVAKGLSIENPEQLFDSILFLAGPLDKAAQKQRGLPAVNEPVYRLVSGRSGIVPAKDQARQQAVRAYLEMLPDKRLDWAAQHVDSPSKALQRDAIMEVAQHATKETEKAVGVLSKALQAERVSEANKQDAVGVLRHTKSPAALAPLRDLCTNPKTPKALKESAIKALGSVPGGTQLLREWQKSDDQVLAPMAREALKENQPRDGATKADDPTIKDLQERLKAPKVADRRSAAAAAGKLAPTKELVEVLRAAIARPEEHGTVKLAGVDSLSGYNDRSAAEGLAVIALDDKQPALVRSNAILGISRMEAGIGQSVLQKVFKSLKETDADLRKLAAGLVEQP